jgi:hypothetical protein
MADFFTRLAERALGIALTIEPMLASMFEPEPASVEDTPLEIVLDEAEPDEQAAALQDEIPSPGDPSSQVAVPSVRSLPQVAARPQSAGPTMSSSREPAMPPALSPLPPHAARTRGRTLEQAAASPAHLPGSEAPFNLARADRQADATLSPSLPRVYATRSEFQPVQSGYRNEYIPGKSLQRQANLPTLAEPVAGSRAELPARPPLPASMVAQQMVLTPTMPPVKTRLHMPERTGSSLGRNSEALPRLARSSSRKDVARKELLFESTREPPGATSAIQVTIGRIEVRATTVPAAEPEKKAPAPSSPVMSLDDYLQSRTKGGHR